MAMRTGHTIKIAVMLIVSAALFLYGVRAVVHFTVDDAGITHAYAKHLAEGRGLVAVVGGAVVEGYSNPSWVFFLALLHAIGIGIPSAAKYLGLVFGFVSILIAAHLPQRLEGRCWKDASWRDFMVVALLGLCPEYLFWLPSGLENGLFLMLLSLLVLLDVAEIERPKRIPYSLLVAFAVAVTRPEGVLYGVAIGAIKFVHALVKHEQRRACLQYCAGLVALLVAYHLWHAYEFQALFANTYYAKAPGLTAEKLETGLKYVWQHAQDSRAVWLSPLILAGSVRRFRRKAPIWAVYVVALVFACFSGGDWMPYGRFFSFAILPSAVLAACGTYDLSKLVTRVGGQLRLGAGVYATAAAMAISVVWYQWHHERLRRIQKDGWCHFCNREADVAGILKLKKSLALPSATLLIHDYGAAAWASDDQFAAFDLLGLCDHTIARSKTEHKNRRQSALRLLYQYFLHEQDRPPTILYFPSSWWPGLTKSTEYLEGYYRLSKRHLGKNHRRDGLFAIHRGAFIDYFPPVDRFEFSVLEDNLVLLGTEIKGRVASGEQLDARIAVVRRGLGKMRRADVKLRVLAGNSTVEGPSEPLFGGDPGLLRQWQPGEPYVVDTALRLPNIDGEEIKLELGISRDGQPWSWRPISVLKGEKL